MDIVETFKHDGRLTEGLRDKILNFWGQIFKEIKQDQLKENTSWAMDAKQMWAFLSATIPIFTHKVIEKTNVPRSRRESNMNLSTDKKQGSLVDFDKMHKKIKSESKCWVNNDGEPKSLHQAWCDGLLFIYLYFLEKDSKIVGLHLYNLIMKQIMRSKHQEIGLWVLAYKLIANSIEMVEIFKKRNASRVLISVLKKYWFQKKVLANQKPSVPDLHMRRAESWKLDNYDQMPYWSSSYRQGNSGQLSEIAEAHSDDAFRGTTLVEVINKSHPFDLNYYSSSTRSKLDRRHISKELVDSQFLDSNLKDSAIDAGRPKSTVMEKTQSSVKPILPPLDIARVRDENQNVLAIRGFHDATRNKSSRSPHRSAGVSRMGAIAEFNLSVAEGEGSFVKGDSSRRDDVSNVLILEKEYENFVNTRGLRTEFAQNSSIDAKRKMKSKDKLSDASCSWQIEAKYLLIKKINHVKEESKNKDEFQEQTHNSVLENYLDDKMRLCLLNLFYLFIEKYEVAEYEGFFNAHNASSHPINLLYCHLSSSEITSKLKQLTDAVSKNTQPDLINKLFDSNLCFCMDFDGTIHYDQKGISFTSFGEFSDTPILKLVLQNEGFSFESHKALRDINSTEVSTAIQNKMVLNFPFSAEKVTIFKIFQKIAISNEFVMKMQVENSLNYMSSYQQALEKQHDFYNLALTKTQQPFQSLLGLASPSKTLINTNNMSSFDASGLNLLPRDYAPPQNVYWANGIAYSCDKVNQEKLRRKSDTFLVRLTNSIWHKIGNSVIEELAWCEDINKDLVLLSQYISKVSSRISIFQIKDTVLAPLIAIKKVLSDVILKDRRSFNTGTGLIQSPFVNVESWRAASNAQKSPNFTRFKENSSSRQTEQQYEKAIREVIASYLDTLSAIFMRCKTQETFKMICEIFIKDRAWQDAVQAYAVFLFKVDLMSESQKKVFQITTKQTLVSIDEALLNKEAVAKGLSSEERRSTDIEKNLNMIKSRLKEVSHQARSAIRYYESINTLIKKALEDSKEKSKAHEKTSSPSQFGDVVAEVGQEYEDDNFDEQDEFDIMPSLEHDIETTKSAQNKLCLYWHKVQKRVLFTYAFLISPTHGVLLEYLDHHGTNYCVSPESDSHIQEKFAEEELVPTTFLLTTEVLKFCDSLFTWADKSLYNKVFTDELVLAFIRTHWVCFLRLYNRSFRSVAVNPLDINPLFDCTNFDQNEYSNFTQLSSNIALLTLWKLHLKWVWVLANNRSEVVRRNLCQFKILDFWVKEIELEYEESVNKEKFEQPNMFMRPQLIQKSLITKSEVMITDEQYSSDESRELPHKNEDTEVENIQTKAANPQKPMQGFSLGLDLSKVAKKGENNLKPMDFNNYKSPTPDVFERSSIGKNSEQAHPIDVSYKAQDDHSLSDDDSSSSGYDFVPPPELNPNAYIPKKQENKPALSLGGPKLGGFGFKLNLSNVPTANLITQEDKSRIQALNDKPETFNKTVGLKFTEEDEASPNEGGRKEHLSNTTKMVKGPPKLPGFGGGGFKLDLTKVPTANLITDEDKQKMKERDVP